MPTGKLRQLLIAALCGLALWAVKAYQQPAQSASRPAAEGSSASQRMPPRQHDAQTTETAAAFDYYLLSLSWSPEYCASAARPNDSQCQRPYAFVAHGLWPQNERGYPENCGQGEYLDNNVIEQMLPIMPSKPLIIHEWKKHGVCSGLSADRYFATLTKAYHSIQVPAAYQAVGEYLNTNVAAIEREFVAANPGLKPNMLAVQCSGQYLQEIRICMDRNLVSRACGSDMKDRCGTQVVLRPSR